MSVPGADRERLPRDPGAQPERTRLAWRRTTLAFAVCVGLMLRDALAAGGGTVTALATLLGFLSCLGFLGVAHRRIADMSAARPHEMRPALVLGAVLCTLAITMAGVVVLW